VIARSGGQENVRGPRGQIRQIHLRQESALAPKTLPEPGALLSKSNSRDPDNQRPSRFAHSRRSGAAGTRRGQAGEKGGDLPLKMTRFVGLIQTYFFAPKIASLAASAARNFTAFPAGSPCGAVLLLME
jgi:hypothetical protein